MPVRTIPAHQWLRVKSVFYDIRHAEVDYVIQKENTIIPVEVKSGTTGRLRSMHEFLAEHPASKYGLRFYGGAYHTDGLLQSYPLYAIANAVGIRQDALDYITG